MLLYQSRRCAAKVEQLIAELTPRQREIMAMVVDGQPTGEIAKKLSISSKTVEVHRCNITKRMGVESVAQLVKLLTIHRVRIDATVGVRSEAGLPQSFQA